MVQARALAVGDGEVMHVALAVHPCRRDAAVLAVFLTILGEAESQSRIEVDGVLHFGGEYIKMVEPLRVAALVEIVTPQQMRALLHRGVELDLETEGIGELQRAALKRLLGERVSDAVLGKERRGLVEIVFVADLEAHAVAGGTRGLAQHQRVMLMLLAAAQVGRSVVAVLDMEADGVFVEFAGGIEIDHVENDVAGPYDVEGRIEDVLRNGHGRFLEIRSFLSSPLPLWERSDRIVRCDPGEGARSIDRPYPLTRTLSHRGRGGAPALLR